MSGVFKFTYDGQGTPADEYVERHRYGGRPTTTRVGASRIAASPATAGAPTARCIRIRSCTIGGRVTRAMVSSTLPDLNDDAIQVYNGLGAIAATQRVRSTASPIDQYLTDAFGSVLTHTLWNDQEQGDELVHV